mgnify:FL=1
MSPIYFILFGIPLLSLIWWIWADILLKKARTPRYVRGIFGIAVLTMLSGFFWVILLRREVITAPIPEEIYALVLLWGLIFLPFLAVPSMLIWLFAKTVHRSWKWWVKATPLTPDNAPFSPSISRRKALATAFFALPVIGTFGTAAFSIPRLRHFRIRELTLTLTNLPPALDGMRIAHVTDTHVGKFTKGDVLDDIAKATTELDADLILLTGDLIDNSITDLPAAIAMVQRMKARAGVFMVEGNHDLFDDPARFNREVRASGIQLLQNQTAIAQVRGHPVQLMGIAWNHHEFQMIRDVVGLVKQLQPGAFPILLAHHPHAFDVAAVHEIPLTFAGHTHGGQLMLSAKHGAGPVMFRYWSGLYQKLNASLIVSNGAGNWFPLRTHAPAEIIHLTLRRA